MKTARTQKWSKEYEGRYVNRATGYVVERAFNFTGWRIVNPFTQATCDTASTKRTACSRADMYAASDAAAH